MHICISHTSLKWIELPRAWKNNVINELLPTVSSSSWWVVLVTPPPPARINDILPSFLLPPTSYLLPPSSFLPGMGACAAGTCCTCAARTSTARPRRTRRARRAWRRSRSATSTTPCTPTSTAGSRWTSTTSAGPPHRSRPSEWAAVGRGVAMAYLYRDTWCNLSGALRYRVCRSCQFAMPVPRWGFPTTILI